MPQIACISIGIHVLNDDLPHDSKLELKVLRAILDVIPVPANVTKLPQTMDLTGHVHSDRF